MVLVTYVLSGVSQNLADMIRVSGSDTKQIHLRVEVSMYRFVAAAVGDGVLVRNGGFGSGFPGGARAAV